MKNTYILLAIQVQHTWPLRQHSSLESGEGGCRAGVWGFPIFEKSHFQGDERKDQHHARRATALPLLKPLKSPIVTLHILPWTSPCNTFTPFSTARDITEWVKCIWRPLEVYGASDSLRGNGLTTRKRNSRYVHTWLWSWLPWQHCPRESREFAQHTAVWLGGAGESRVRDGHYWQQLYTSCTTQAAHFLTSHRDEDIRTR